MKATLTIDDELLAKAAKYSGENEKTALLSMGLEALIEREAARKLAALGGKMPKFSVPQRRRPVENSK